MSASLGSTPSALLSPSVQSAIDPHPLQVDHQTPLPEVMARMSQGGEGRSLHPSHPSATGLSTDFTLPGPSSFTCALVMEVDKLIGIFTVQDALRMTASGIPLTDLTIAEVMSHPVITLAATDFHDLFTALSLLHRQPIDHLPILDSNHHLLGLVTPTSIQRVLQPINLLKLQRAEDLLPTPVVYVSPSTDLLKISQLMTEAQVSYGVVVDPENSGQATPPGVLTAQDILQIQARGLDLALLSAQAVMQKPSFCLNRRDSLWLAYGEMQQQQVSYLVVAGSPEKLPEIMDQTSLLQAIAPAEIHRAVQQLRQSIRQLETEKMEILTSRNAELENQVRSRTRQLEEQAKGDRLLATITLRIHQSLDLAIILKTATTEVQQLLQTDRVLIYRLAVDGSGIVVEEAVQPDCQSLLGQTIHDPCFVEHWLDLYRQGRIQVIEDIYQAGLTECHIDLLAQFQVKANLVIPIVQEQHLWGLLVTQHCSQPRYWHEGEISLLQQLATQIGIAIQQSELYRQVQAELAERKLAEAALQKNNAELELRVEERTKIWRQVNDQLLLEIIERRKIETELREATSQLQAVLDAVPGLVSWVSSELRYLGVNRHMAAAFNYPVEHFVGQRVGFLEDNSNFLEFIRHLFASPDQEAFQEITITVNGMPQSHLVVAQKYNQDQSAVLVSINTTEHRQAEQALQKTEAKFRNLVEQTKDWVWEVDVDLVFTYVNPQAQEMIGYPPEEILGKRMFDFMTPDEAMRCGTVLDYFTSHLEAFNNLEQNLIHKQGHPIVLETSGLPVYGSQGQLQGYQGITRDITERKQVERDIRKALTKEKELGELKSRFISMASHEFRTPLTTILASAEGLERYQYKWAEEKKLTSIQRIQVAAQHMTKLLNDVLIIGKADAGKLEFEPTILNLEKFCHDLMDEMSLEAAHQNRVVWSNSGNFNLVWADEKLLRQILVNLLSNALKYSASEHRIDFRLLSEGNQIVFQVQDQGIGIPKEDQKRLFESFHRATNVGTIPGTGLGLAIAQKSVKAHGGKITVFSEVGGGTTFTVFIPFNPADSNRGQSLCKRF